MASLILVAISSSERGVPSRLRNTSCRPFSACRASEGDHSYPGGGRGEENGMQRLERYKCIVHSDNACI